MNIFVLDRDPKEAAVMQFDSHCVKMTLEVTQLLSTVAIERGFTAPYKPTHINHPATRWLKESSANWNWLCLHGLALCEEYTLRYGKIHKCQPIIQDMQSRTEEIWGDNKIYTDHTSFAQCMPDEYKNADAVEAYRNYYMGEKASIAVWKMADRKPDWFKV
jgi:hypothetical protein